MITLTFSLFLLGIFLVPRCSKKSHLFVVNTLQIIILIAVWKEGSRVEKLGENLSFTITLFLALSVFYFNRNKTEQLVN